MTYDKALIEASKILSSDSYQNKQIKKLEKLKEEGNLSSKEKDKLKEYKTEISSSQKNMELVLPAINKTVTGIKT